MGQGQGHDEEVDHIPGQDEATGDAADPGHADAPGQGHVGDITDLDRGQGDAALTTGNRRSV